MYIEQSITEQDQNYTPTNWYMHKIQMVHQETDMKRYQNQWFASTSKME